MLYAILVINSMVFKVICRFKTLTSIYFKDKKWSMKGSSLKFFGKLGATFCWISLYHYQNFERKFNDEVSIYFLPIEFSQKGKNFSIMRCSSDLTILSQLLLKKNQKEHAFLPFPNHKFLRKVEKSISDANFITLTFQNFLFRYKFWHKLV